MEVLTLLVQLLIALFVVPTLFILVAPYVIFVFIILIILVMINLE